MGNVLGVENSAATILSYHYKPKVRLQVEQDELLMLVLDSVESMECP